MESMRPRSSALVITIAMCIALGAGLLYRHTVATQERQQYLGTLNELSNSWQDVRLKLDEQKLVNLSLERDLSTSANSDTNEVTHIFSDPTTGSRGRHAPQGLSALDDPKMTELQDERDRLTVRIGDLTGSLAKLDGDMAETLRKLEASEGDRQTLLQELKRLEADRTALMSQFNNLAQVREQLRKLKAEQSISRRLEWIRRGTYGSYKGAELLRKGFAGAAPVSQNYDLNVEVRRNERPRVLPIAP